MYKRKNFAVVCVAVALVAVLILPMGAKASMQPYASDYLLNCSGRVSDLGGGKVQVGFSMIAVHQMEMLGATMIKLYESTDNANWTRVRTYNFVFEPSMMGYGKSTHSATLDEYQGVSGRYYKANITFLGGDANGSDSQSYWTSVKRAA